MSTTASTAPTLSPPKDGRKVWQKSSYDTANQTQNSATNVGYLRKNDSRIDILATMDKGVSTQYFYFQNLSDTKVQFLPYGGTKDMRYQLLNQAGQVVADSKSGMGKASENYTALAKGTYNLGKGHYYLVVQRDPTKAQDTQAHVTMQLKEGDGVKNDYINQIVPEPAQVTQEKAVAAVQSISPILLNSATFSIFSTAGTANHLFGLGGYDIFNQKTGA
jgi:hypothetical protein